MGMRSFPFPECVAAFVPERAAASVLLVAGGRPPESSWLRAVSEGRAVWAIDRGAAACRRAGIVPDLFVGDCDSASSEDLDWIRLHGVPRVEAPTDKDMTDLQIALSEIAPRCGAGTSVLLSGTFGGRFDHALSAVFSLLWAEEWKVRVLAFADHEEALFPLRGEERIEVCCAREAFAVSLLAIEGKAEGVDAIGFRWPLFGVTIDAGRPYAVSNEIAAPDRRCCVAVRQGRLLVSFVWKRETDA